MGIDMASSRKKGLFPKASAVCAYISLTSDVLILECP
jgi:hypothetical protein